MSAPLVPVAVLACLAVSCASSPEPPPPEAPARTAAELYEDALLVFRRRDYERADGAFQIVAWQAERDGARSVEVEALAMVARCKSILRDATGIQWLARAKEKAHPRVPRGWSRYLQVRGIYEREAGERETATATFVELYDYCIARGLPERAIDAAHHVAIAAEPEEQVVWAERAIQAAEEAGDERWLAILWNNLGYTYETLDEPERVLDAYRRARDYHYRTGGDHERLLADWAVAKGQRLTGRYETAKREMAAVLARAEERYRANPVPATLEWVGYSSQELGETCAALGEIGAALAHLRRARDTLVDAGVHEHWPEAVVEIETRIMALERRQ